MRKPWREWYIAITGMCAIAGGLYFASGAKDGGTTEQAAKTSSVAVTQADQAPSANSAVAAPKAAWVIKAK